MNDLHDGCIYVTTATGGLLFTLFSIIRTQYQLDSSGKCSLQGENVTTHLSQRCGKLLISEDVSRFAKDFNTLIVPFEWYCLTSSRGLYLRLTVGKHGELHSRMRSLWFIFGVSSSLLVLDFFRFAFEPNIRFFPLGVFVLQSLFLIAVIFFAATHLNVAKAIQAPFLADEKPAPPKKPDSDGTAQTPAAPADSKPSGPPPSAKGD